MSRKILCINPGSTSTRIAVFEDTTPVLLENLNHSNEELEAFKDVQGQLTYRFLSIQSLLAEHKFDLSEFHAVVGRGGALRPMGGGIFEISEDMLHDCRTSRYSEHPSNLGCQLAKRFADPYHLPCFVVDPPLIDEFAPASRLSGFAPIRRISAFHALNEKIVARFMAEELGKPVTELQLITVHLGSGISVTAQKKGMCIDNTFGSGGDGPFSPERAGRMPGLELLRMMNRPDRQNMVWKKTFSKQSGLFSYLGTNDVQKITKQMEAGNALAKALLDGMAYMISREIAAYAAGMDWNIDAIGITGAIARSEYITGFLKRQISFIAPVFLYPGEFEMEGLARGGLRALNQEEEIKIYSSSEEHV